MKTSTTLYGELYNQLLEAGHIILPPKESNEDDEFQPPNHEALLIIKYFLSNLVQQKRLDNYYKDER
jgi:hypothetical protein